LDLPAELIDLWSICRQARLFEDVDYGQWGLVLLDPMASAARSARERATRPLEFKDDDVVIGEFLGDQELLVLAPSEDGRRQVIVALPLDPRADWLPAGTNLGEFFDTYFVVGGRKFWETFK